MGQQPSFVTSAVKPEQFPETSGREVALVGRSNVGKSSLINSLCRRHRLARTSRTPGRTRLINFYYLDDHWSLADLPGYGFSKAPKDVVRRWDGMIKNYFNSRQQLAGVIHVIDIRHPPTADDEHMREWLLTNHVNSICVATKTDKIPKSKRNKSLERIAETLELPGLPIAFSAKTGLGRKAVMTALTELGGEKEGKQ